MHKAWVDHSTLHGVCLDHENSGHLVVGDTEWQDQAGAREDIKEVLDSVDKAVLEGSAIGLFLRVEALACQRYLPTIAGKSAFFDQ